MRNYLIEGVSGTGKTCVCDGLLRRGYQAIHGDRALAYKGYPETGVQVDRSGHEFHIWDIGKVRSLVADHHHQMTFFCGGSRNFRQFIDLFDKVFVLDVDRHTLNRRLAQRPEGEYGGTPGERDLILRLHASQADVPKKAVRVDAAVPLGRVVDAILVECKVC